MKQNQLVGILITRKKSWRSTINIDFSSTDLHNVDFLKLLYSIKLSESPIFFKTQQVTELFAKLSKFIHYFPKGGMQADFIADFFANNSSKEINWNNIKKTISQTEQFPDFKVINVSSHVFHNAGADEIQELAFVLAAAIENLDKLTDLKKLVERRKIYIKILYIVKY